MYEKMKWHLKIKIAGCDFQKDNSDFDLNKNDIISQKEL